MNNFTGGLIVISTALLMKLLLNYFYPIPMNETLSEKVNTIKVYRPEIFENMKKSNKIYLGYMGNLYDVSEGKKFYGPGGSYEFFAGKDATRAFVTGDFVNDLNDNIEDLSDQQIAELFNWKKTYDNGPYTFLGYLEGAFYDKEGNKKAVLLEAEKKREIFKEKEQTNSKWHERFPGCNSQWNGDSGETKVWCSTESGGIKRNWIGVPRLVFNSFHNSHICGCVSDEDLDHPNLKLYENCDTKSVSCSFINK